MKNMIRKVVPIFLMIIAYSASAHGVCQQSKVPAFDCFFLKNNENLIRPEDTRIFNGHVSVIPVQDDLMGFADPFAPPYVFRDFKFETRIDGKKFPTMLNLWNINDYDRGYADGPYYIKSTITLAEDAPVLLVGGMLINMDEATRTFRVEFSGSGSFGKASEADWRAPGLSPAVPVSPAYDPGSHIFTLTNSYGGMYCYADLQGASLNAAGALEVQYTIPAKRAATMRLTCSIGEDYQGRWLLNRHKGPLTLVAAGKLSINTDLEGLFENLPYIVSNDFMLRALYDRSILSLLDSRWEIVREFLTMPEYFSGGMDEEHVALPLEHYYRASRFKSLADREGARLAIKNFIVMNPVKYGAFGPVKNANSMRGGKWNYYRIVKLVYDYLSITGDFDLALSEISGKPIHDYLIEYADDGYETLQDPDIRYYERSEIPETESFNPEYFGYVPTLNAQRVWMYRAVADILEAAHERESVAVLFRKKAAVLEDIINSKMWNEKTGWYDALDRDGKRKPVHDATVFEMTSYGIMSDEMIARLTDHINMDEYLGPFGLLPVPVGENVAGVVDGVNVALMPNVIEGMYNAGLNERANELIRKIYWWGLRFSYLPHVITGNSMGYRDEYGYASIAGLSAAEAVAFGYFGVKIGMNGEVSVEPPTKRLAYMTDLKGMNIRGRKVTLSMGIFNCEVRINEDEPIYIPLGKRTVIIPGEEYVNGVEYFQDHCYESGGIRKSILIEKSKLEKNKLPK